MCADHGADYSRAPPRRRLPSDHPHAMLGAVFRPGGDMKTMRSILAALVVALVPGSYLLFAQQPAPPQPAPPQPAQKQPMSFFVTSVGKGDGANLGGLAGADAHCQALAKAAGQGRSEEHTSELQSRLHLVCRLLLEKKNK